MKSLFPWDGEAGGAHDTARQRAASGSGHVAHRESMGMASSHPSSKYTDAGLNILSCGAPPSSASSPVVTGWVVRSAAGVAFFDFGFDFEHLGMDVQKSARRNNL